MSNKFSIIIPCYNQANFLNECYISILSQLYENWEAIFINDGSTDETEQVLKRLSNYDSKVKIYSKENGGLSSARNFGINKATGDYFLFLDCDDMLLPNCLSRIQHEIETKQDLHLIQVGYRHICQNGTVVYRVVTPTENHNLLPEIFYNNLGPVHSFCIHKDIVLKTGLFDETLKSCEDWDFWLRTAFVVRNFSTISEPLVDYRMNNKSMSRNSFVLYNALKTVSLRAKDKAFETHSSNEHRNIPVKFQQALKKKLSMCLGLSIMQGNIEDSYNLFQKEINDHHLLFEIEDFKIMSSYLTFRYHTSFQESSVVLNQYKPLFIKFFKKNGYSNKKIKRCLWVIFSSHYYAYYKSKFSYSGLVFHKFKLQVI